MLDFLVKFPDLLHSAIVFGTVIMFGALGEIITEKSGNLNLGVPGIMYFGGIAGLTSTFMYENVYCVNAGIEPSAALCVIMCLVASFLASALGGLIYSFLTITLRTNQNVTGLTITTFGLGLYFFIGKGLGDRWPVMTSADALVSGFSAREIPLLSSIPVVGKALFSHNILVYLGILVAAAVWWYLTCTKTGLRLRSVGENPGAADSVGVNILLYKYVHLILGSGIMGLGGFYMALNMGGSFEGSNCWINGYGWIAIALVIFANWNPLYAILGTLVFGFFNTLQIYSGSLAGAFPDALGWLNSIPSHLFKALPFLITAIVLVVTSIRKREGSGQPAALGLNYFREER